MKTTFVDTASQTVPFDSKYRDSYTEYKDVHPYLVIELGIRTSYTLIFNYIFFFSVWHEIDTNN